MSNRYVWNRFNTKIVPTNDITKLYNAYLGMISQATAATSYTIQNGLYYPAGNTISLPQVDYFEVRILNYPYVFPSVDGSPTSVMYSCVPENSNWYWYFYNFTLRVTDTMISTLAFDEYTLVNTTEKDSLLGQVSSKVNSPRPFGRRISNHPA